MSLESQQSITKVEKKSTTVPKWLSIEYLEDKLSLYRKVESVKIRHLDIKAATRKGDNYASLMSRMTIRYETECIGAATDYHTGSYILKVAHEIDDAAYVVMAQYGIYECELTMYEKILPRLSDLLKEIGDTDKLFVDTIYVDNEHSAIILEDLSSSNYVMADRLTGIDMEHTNISLRKLAKMHATAAVLNQRSPGIFKTFDCGIFNRHTEGLAPYFVGVLDACARYVENTDDNCNIQKYSKKLFELKPMLMEYAARVFDPNEGFFNTLVHGDFWVNNILFKYDPKGQQTPTPVDAIPVDFQFSCWASPAVDLHYFFNTSLREELRLHQQDELFQYYYNILIDTLNQLRYAGRIPSLHDFRLQMEAKGFYGATFVSACIAQPMITNNQTDDADFSALIGDDERGRKFKDLLFTNQKAQKNLQRLLPIFDRKGMLD